MSISTPAPVPLTRALAIVLLFVCVGPPLGSLAFGLFGGGGAWLTGQSPGMAGMLFYAGLLAIPLSWLVGGIQAAVTGAAVAAFAMWTGRISVAVAGIVSLAAGIVHLHGEELDLGFSTLLLAAHLVPAILCALVAKATWTGAPRRSAAGAD